VHANPWTDVSNGMEAPVNSGLAAMQSIFSNPNSKLNSDKRVLLVWSNDSGIIAAIGSGFLGLISRMLCR
jgi:hypothetical protein